MQYQQFIKRVQDYVNIGDREEATRATSAALQTIAERLAGNEASELFAQLPKDLIAALPPDADQAYEKFGVDEFLRRVAERAGVDDASAQRYAQAVMKVLHEAVSPGEMRDVRVQFPPEFAVLFAMDEVHARAVGDGSA
ncbi:MAG: DUF2267 domain-containing protein [Chloroflexaceae bacterium]|jgi:uncharacterized protein (DUF2267 family)|nr:DUF2267 domain-containing protein [Chloroflexaceae bacterium]